MSLVPIIYTSLILFFGMLIVVLLISYASFKAKAKTNPVIEEQIRKKEETLRSPKPIIQSKNLAITENFLVEVKTPIKNKALIYEQQPTIVSSNYFDKYQTPKPIQKQENEPKRIIEKRPFSQTQINKNRLLIMNESPKFHQKDNEYTRANREQYYKSDLSKYNILSFYSDGIENDMMALTAVPTTKAV
jgi:hypothetical protein